MGFWRTLPRMRIGAAGEQCRTQSTVSTFSASKGERRMRSRGACAYRASMTASVCSSHRRDAHDDVHDAIPQARASFPRRRQQSS